MHDNRNTVLISLSRLISEMGSVALRFALSLYILDFSGSPFMSGFVFAFTYIPSILINIFAGVWVDRSNKKKLLVFSDIFSGLATLIFFVLFLTNSHTITLLIFYVCVLYSFQAIFMLALNSSIPELVSEDRVINVNSSIQSISALVNILGIFLGATIYIMLGIEMILLIDGISFIVSGIINMFFIYRKKATEDIKIKPSYKQSLKEVYVYISESKAVKYLLLIFVAINFFIAPLTSVVLLYVIREELQMIGYEMAFIEAALAIGFILGALLVSIKKVGDYFSDKIFVLLQLTALTVVLWIFPVVPLINIDSKVIITIIYAIITIFTGMFNVMANIPMITYVQIKIPENIRASIFGVVSTITSISVPIGFLIFGVALEVIPWAYLVVVSGIALMLIGYMAQRNNDLRVFFRKDSIEEKNHNFDNVEGNSNL